jgi:hypothetical protein
MRSPTRPEWDDVMGYIALKYRGVHPPGGSSPPLRRLLRDAGVSPGALRRGRYALARTWTRWRGWTRGGTGWDGVDSHCRAKHKRETGGSYES